jgi:CubicO group peptidase (beta-lactamase class C family)
MVATGMMRLVDEGRVELRAPVREYIPDFTVQDETVSREVTVWHLLTHSPGWEGQLGTADRGTETHAYFTAGLRDLPQLARPGEVWSYNNAGFRVAGRILEVMTGAVIHDALRELVFDPLELPLATSRTGEAMSYRFAQPHRDRNGRTEVVRPFELPVGTGSGGAAMSISNLLRYAEFHMGDGTLPDGRRVLSAASVEVMRTPQLTKNSCTDEMGAGWHLRRLQGVQTAAHGGTLAGHTLHVQLVPGRNLAFGILTNHREGWRLIHDVERAILQSYEGLSLAPGQATGGNRGVNEPMITHGAPLADQPRLDEYVGSYRRPPVGGVEVTEGGGRLMLGGSDGRGLVFWGPDLAYATSDYEGYPVEFVRNDSGQVGWIRMNGRIARKV